MTNAITKRTETAIGRFTPEQYDIIKRTLCANATPDQLGLFIAVCNRTGLDPFAKQIYAVVRQSRNGPPQMAIQVGIDGLRLIAERSRDYGGQDAPEWCGPDGVWTDVWLDDENPPTAARVRVYRNGHQVPTVGIAKYKEFVQTQPEWNGNQRTGRNIPTAMWRDMPANQLAKCAESQALRKAFPNELRDISGDFDLEAAALDVTPQDVRATIEQPPIQRPQPRADVDEQGELAPEPPQDAPEPPEPAMEGEVLTAAEAAEEAPPARHGIEFLKGAENVAKAMNKEKSDIPKALGIKATQNALIEWANQQGAGAIGKLVEALAAYGGSDDA